MELGYPQKYVCEYYRNNQKEFGKVSVSMIEFGICSTKSVFYEQRTLKIVNNCLNTNIYSYLETSGGQSSNL